MKTKIYLIASVLLTILFSACNSDDSPSQNEFQRSQKVLQDFKHTSNNSYMYTVTNGSWIGISWETTLTILEGKVIERKFKYIQNEDLEITIPGVELAWTENKNEIGIHKNSAAANPLTLDEIYHQAENDWLLERKNTTTYFEIKNNGLLSICGYIEDDCADDCFRGITIKSIQSLGNKTP